MEVLLYCLNIYQSNSDLLPSFPFPSLLIATLHSIFNQFGGGRGGGVSHQRGSPDKGQARAARDRNLSLECKPMINDKGAPKFIYFIYKIKLGRMKHAARTGATMVGSGGLALTLCALGSLTASAINNQLFRMPPTPRPFSASVGPEGSPPPRRRSTRCSVDSFWML